MKFLKIAGLVGVVALAFGIGFSWRDLRNGELPSKRTVEKLLGTPEKRESPTQVFKTNFNLILKDYYKPVDPKELKYSGMEGLLAALGVVVSQSTKQSS